MAAFLPFLPSIISGIAGIAGSAFSGGKPRPGKSTMLPTMTPEQQQLQDQIMQQYGGSLPGAFEYLRNALSPERISELEQPYIDQFNQQIAPGIANRFGGSGWGGGSGLNQALGAAAGNLSNQLSMNRANYRQNALSGLQNFASPAFQSRFNTLYEPGRPTGMQNFGSGLSGLAGMSLPYTLMGTFDMQKPQNQQEQNQKIPPWVYSLYNRQTGGPSTMGNRYNPNQYSNLAW